MSNWWRPAISPNPASASNDDGRAEIVKIARPLPSCLVSQIDCNCPRGMRTASSQTGPLYCCAKRRTRAKNEKGDLQFLASSLNLHGVCVRARRWRFDSLGCSGEAIKVLRFYSLCLRLSMPLEIVKRITQISLLQTSMKRNFGLVSSVVHSTYFVAVHTA